VALPARHMEWRHTNLKISTEYNYIDGAYKYQLTWSLTEVCWHEHTQCTKPSMLNQNIRNFLWMKYCRWWDLSGIWTVYCAVSAKPRLNLQIINPGTVSILVVSAVSVGCWKR